MSKQLGAVLTLALGLAVGAGGCGPNTDSPAKDKTGGKDSGAPADKGSPEASAAPRLQAAQTSFFLGDVDFGQPYQHAFKVENAGTRPLTLKVRLKNCACFDIDIKPEGNVRAGGEAQVVFRWTPRPGQYGTKPLSADLETNDPNTPAVRLELTGRIQPKVRVAPKTLEYIDFQKVQAGSPQTRDFKVFSTDLDRFGLEAKVSHPGLTVKTFPLAPDTEVDDFTAKSGYRVAVSTTENPPQGYFIEKLELQITGKENRTLSIPVYGEVDSGVFQLLPKDELRLEGPQLAQEASKKFRLHLFKTDGEPTVEVASSTPSFLKVSLPKKIGNDGKDWEFEVSIAKDNKEVERVQADRYFEGKIVLKTSVPGARQVQVRVVWAPPSG
jgi:hypothetical protein